MGVAAQRSRMTSIASRPVGPVWKLRSSRMIENGHPVPSSSSASAQEPASAIAAWGAMCRMTVERL